MRRASSSLLRFILRLQGAVVLGCQILRGEDAVEIQIRRRENAQPRCPDCSAVLTGQIRGKRRRWRHLDLFRVRTFVAADVREGYCRRDGRRVEAVPWADPASRHTHEFDLQVSSLVQVSDRTATARMFRVAWRTVERIVRRVVAARLPKNRFDGVSWIGIDETSYKRGHHYLTVVCDLERGRVIWIGEGKSGKTLDSFFDEFGEERARGLRVVCMDMSQAYATVVGNRAAQADIVYDKFHVVKLLLEAVDEVRRDEARDLSKQEKKILKGLRFAFLRNPKNRTPKDVVAIKEVQSINAKLARTYQIRVDFEDLWDCGSVDEARDFLARWTRAAMLSRREPLRRFAQTVRSHLEGILAYFEHGVTNAALEGTNNKIKLTIHRAFGFRSLDGLMAMVYLCCGGLPALEND